MFKISRASLLRYVRRGLLPPPIRLGRTARWRAQDIEAAVQRLADNDTE
jgi:predicted DNA-binding transcriptional regulator AlpA